MLDASVDQLVAIPALVGCGVDKYLVPQGNVYITLGNAVMSCIPSHTTL
jgi:hypothetical protein